MFVSKEEPIRITTGCYTVRISELKRELEDIFEHSRKTKHTEYEVESLNQRVKPIYGAIFAMYGEVRQKQQE